MPDPRPDDLAYRYTLVGKHVIEMVESGALKPGDRVPSLRQMSNRMRVSITTVNQAYVELESQGIIESRPKSGFFVRDAFKGLPVPPPCEPCTPIEPRELNRSDLIRTVRELLGRPDILPFGVASPHASLLPAKDLSRIMASVLKEDPNRFITYETVAGNAELRRQIAFRCIDAGATVLPDEVIITTGAMEAISIAVRCLARPGDVVAIQSPAFYCFMQMLDTMGLRVIELPSRPEGGISPSDLAEAVQQYDVKACILNPNFNNPDGSIMSDEAKEEVVRILEARSIPLIEDDVSGDLHFGPVRPHVCKKFDRKGMVMHCSSFSKTIAPGYRVGWLIPGKFYEKALTVKVDTTVCTATPSQVAIAEFLRSGKYDRHLKRLRSAVEKQMQTLKMAICRYFPSETKVTRPTGGVALWIELPEHIDSREYFFRAKANSIGIVPGLICSTFDKYRHFIRLTCSGIWNREIEKGVETLGRLASE